jgi:hypothetical protein
MTTLDTLEPSPAQLALANSCQPQIRRLQVTETEDHVLISGRVKSYYLKSLALETVKTAACPRPMVFNVEVED